MEDIKKKSVIDEEVRRLSVQIACLRFDYVDAVSRHLATPYRQSIADELCELERQRTALMLGNFHVLPYNIKLLYNNSK